MRTEATTYATQMEVLKEQASRKADDILARLGAVVADLEALALDSDKARPGYDLAGVTLDTISEAFSATLPPLAPGLGEYKETCGALATLLFQTKPPSPTMEQPHCFSAEDGFKIAQVLIKSEMNQGNNTHKEAAYYLLLAAAIVAQRTFEIAEPKPAA